MTPHQVEQHWTGLLELQRHTLIWPQPQELYQAGSKCYLAHLVSAAAISEGYSHPISASCEPTADLVADLADGKVSGVLKRDWSSASKHVFMEQGTRTCAEAKAALEQALSAQEDAYNQTMHAYFSKPRWFIQPYLPAMTLLGEIRTFIVNGMIITNLITIPDTNIARLFSVEQPLSIASIASLQWVHLLPYIAHELSNSQLMNRNTGTYTFNGSSVSPVFFDAATSFPHYALRMFSKLVAAEEYIVGQDSGLRVFARLDISLFTIASSGQCYFMVNDVQRGHHTAFFGEADTIGQFGILRQELSHTLHYIAHRFRVSHTTES